MICGRIIVFIFHSTDSETINHKCNLLFPGKFNLLFTPFDSSLLTHIDICIRLPGMHHICEGKAVAPFLPLRLKKQIKYQKKGMKVTMNV